MRRADFRVLAEAADDVRTVRHLKEIESLQAALLESGVFPEDGPEFELSLRGTQARLHRVLAPTSIDTLFEAWFDQVHLGPHGADWLEGATVVDVGANEGFFTLSVLQLGAARVIALEADPRIAARARQNVFMNGWAERCVVLNSTIAGSCGVRRFESIPTVSAVSALEIVRTHHAWLTDDLIEKSSVACHSLDCLLGKNDVFQIDLLKVDVEGGEDEVLSGALELLRRTSRVSLEYHGDSKRDACVRRLRAAGFSTFIDATLREVYGVRGANSEL